MSKTKTNARLNTEFKGIIMNPPLGVTAGLKNDNNLFEWVATIAGPSATPYDGGIFTLNITFPLTYPFQPPKMTFVTPIYHCNINRYGEICLDLLKEAWSPSLTIEKMLLCVSSLLAAPNPTDPLVPDIAHLYESNRVEHDRIAREHTIRHAMNI
jgi:ubiquitin-protein ligase